MRLEIRAPNLRKERSMSIARLSVYRRKINVAFNFSHLQRALNAGVSLGGETKRAVAHTRDLFIFLSTIP